jgi:1-acyl-sn-glycerol-3-phosphate acyltransferase
VQLIAPLERALDVRLDGAHRVPGERPLMFVGNHQILALDTPFLLAAVWREAGILLRALADDVVFTIPVLGALARRFGVVRASREACEALFAERQCVLVYPGGAREAAKGAGHAYELEWWGRLGFARLALEHRCTVVPVAATGLDDHVRILVDREDVLGGPLRAAIDRLGVRHDLLPPLFVPTGRPRLHFSLCEPIPIDHFDGHDLETGVHRLRAEVAEAIDAELGRMLPETPAR